MIIRVAIRQFARTIRVWLGVLIVSAAATAMTCASFLQISTAQALPAQERQAILSLAYGQVAFTLITTLIIAGSTAGFASTATRTDLARLQLAGVSPIQLVGMVSMQVACASLIGVLIGGGLGVAFAQSWLDWTVAFTAINRPVPIRFALSNVLAAAAAITGVMVLGAVRAAIAAIRVPVVQAVRGISSTQTSKYAFGGRLIAALATGGVATALAAGLMSLNVGKDHPLDENDLSLVVGVSVLLIIAVLSLVAVTAGFIFPVISRLWTAVVPASWSLSWHLARSGLRRRDGRLKAAVTPVMIAVTIPAALMTIFLSVGSAMGGPSASNVNVGGLIVLIAPALAIAIVGSAMLVLMGGAAQRTRLALINVLGASRSLGVKIAFAEAIIIMVTATLVASGLVGLTGQFTRAAFASEVAAASVVSYGAIGIAASSAWLILVLITTIPVLLGRPRTLADISRSFD